MAGDLSTTCLDGAKVDPAAFLGDIDGEFGEQSPPDSTAGNRGWTPESGARDAQLRRVNPAGEEEGWVECKFDPRCGKNIVRHSVNAER